MRRAGAARRARSSAGEHTLHTGGVRGSIPLAPTMILPGLTGVSMADEPERLPPPPFCRTRYFAFDVLSRRDYLDPIEIRRIIRRPERREVQNDGRIRL